MTRREQLREQYEDALFALIMDEVSEIEGQKALEENEALKNDPDAAVPDMTMKRCRRVIDREFAKRNARTAGRISIRVLNKVAMVALLGAFLFTGAFAASETFRVSTLNLVLETFEDHTNIDFTSSPIPESTDSGHMSNLEIGWIPEGFELTSDEKWTHAQSLIYSDLNGNTLYIDLTFVGENGKMGIDTEDAAIEHTTIHGYDVMLVTKDYLQAVMAMPDHQQILCVASEGTITMEEIIKVMENICFS